VASRGATPPTPTQLQHLAAIGFVFRFMFGFM